jgi:hypothetical protein
MLIHTVFEKYTTEYFFNSSIKRSQLNLGHLLSETPNGTNLSIQQYTIPDFALIKFGSSVYKEFSGIP